MKCLRVSCLPVVLLLFLAQGFTQQPGDKILPDDFSTRAFTHIIHLAQMGHRQVGTENDRRSVQYIQNEFENMNIGVEIQPFDFESFEYTNVFFEVEGKQFDFVGVGFNPYKNRREYEGTALLIDLNDAEIHYTREELEGKSIITNAWNGHFRLLRYTPELIIYVDLPGFGKLKSQDDLSYKLSYDIQPTQTQGSDQLTFAQAGIVTSGVGIISEHSHTPQDIPENINPRSLKIAGEIAIHVVMNTLEGSREKPE